MTAMAAFTLAAVVLVGLLAQLALYRWTARQLAASVRRHPSNPKATTRCDVPARSAA